MSSTVSAVNAKRVLPVTASKLCSYLNEPAAVEVEPSVTGSIPGLVDKLGGALVIPVVALDNDGVLAEILARELPVVEVERQVVLVDDLGEVLDDFLVIANLVMTGPAHKVATESVKTSTELLKDDGLSLDLTDGLGDDLLGHFLEDKETLLNDVNFLNPANKLVLLLYKDLLELVAVPVVNTVEVIKALEGLVASPLVEGDGLYGLVDRHLFWNFKRSEDWSRDVVNLRVEVGRVDISDARVKVGRVEVGGIKVGRVEIGRVEIGRVEIGRVDGSDARIKVGGIDRRVQVGRINRRIQVSGIQVGRILGKRSGNSDRDEGAEDSEEGNLEKHFEKVMRKCYKCGK